MQTKKASPIRPELKKSSSKPKIMSPQKTIPTRFSPKKTNNLTKVPSRDYFNYTPLRQNKSLTCSTPELNVNKSMKKENTEIVAQRKVILEQGKLLQEKLKQFKCKIQANTVSAFTSRSSYSQLSMFCKIVEKKVKKVQKQAVLGTFRIFGHVFFEEVVRPRKVYCRRLMARTWNGFKKIKELMRHASKHYELQLMVKTFLKWNEMYTLSRSSSITNDSNQSYIKDHLSTASVSDSFSDLFLISESLYNNSVKLNFGLSPWKKFIQMRRRKKALMKLASENYECKMQLKGFSGLFKFYQAKVLRPKQMRKIFITQKAFNELKKYEHYSEEDELKLQQFRKVRIIQNSLTSKALDAWNIFNYSQKLHAIRKKHTKVLIQSLNSPKVA